MLRRTLLAAGAVALLAQAPPALGAARFSYGVASGDVTATSAILWARAPRAGTVRVVVIREGTGRVATVRSVRATAKHDRTVSVKVANLRPGTRYSYLFLQGHAQSARGRFTTAPRATRNATVSFAVSGDADAQPDPYSGAPFYNDFDVYKRMAEEHNAFNVNLGDTIYSDSEVPGAGTPALTLRAKWAKYRQNLALPALRQLRSATSLISQWDDHEFINDFSRAENPGIYAVGKQAFLDYAPASWTSSLGTYRTFRWGRNLEVFLLDLRSFRSAKASAGGVCDNPLTGQPDLAPTLSPLVRQLVGISVTPLVAPLDPACREAIDDPARTMLGDAQKAAFKQAIASSTARFKVILTEDPIQQFSALPYDRWEGYAAERGELLAFLTGNVRNVAFIATDTHANFVNDVRFSTLENGAAGVDNRIDSGITEVVTGPVATMTFAREIDATLGVVGAAGDIVSGLLRSDAIGSVPGIAMRCAAVDAYSYVEVTATAHRLTISSKQVAPGGKAIALRDDVTHHTCAPTVLMYQAGPYAGAGRG